MNKRHLSDEQFEELLAGNSADLAASAHLQECAKCKSELDLIRSSVADLRDLSAVWAEQRGMRIHPPSQTSMMWHSIPRWALGAAAFLLCGIGIAIHSHSIHEEATAQVNRYDTVAPTDDELAQDNQLLQSIDDEIHPQVRTEVPVSDLVGSQRAARRSLSREVIN